MGQEVNPWDSRYNIEDYYYGIEPNDFLKESVGLIPKGGSVLCLAEGEGRNAVFLAGLGFRVTAVDGSTVGLDKLKRLANEKGVNVHSVVADLNDFEIKPNTWDAVVSIWCHVPKSIRIKLHRESVLGLKTNGVFIHESYHPRQLEYKTGGPPTADLMLTADVLVDELKGLHFLKINELDREIHEGKGHNGLSAVVQGIARK
jgi:SAM-dependent methyltransferase